MHSIEPLSLPKSVPTGIEVWQIRFNLQAPISREDLLLLSEQERAQALRFHRHADQLRSIVTRAILRRILGEKVMCSPGKLRFSVHPHGKPYLLGDTSLEFNVSHAGRFALIALSVQGQIGVDIEDCNRQVDFESLSQYVFTSTEKQLRLSTNEDFIRRWVAKEAVMKALGVGITEHLRDVSVIPDCADEYSVECENQEWLGVKAWSLAVPVDYAAALAARYPQASRGEMERQQVSK